MENLVQTTIQELRAWIEKNNSENENFEEIIRKIQIMIAENKLKPIFRQYEYLDIWYSRNFIYQSLVYDNYSLREKIAENGYYIIKIVDKIANKYPNNPPIIAFDLYLYWIANVFIMGQIEQTKELLQIINNHLNTNLLKGGQNYKSVAWFVLKMLNAHFEFTIDYSKYNIPENMGLYDKVFSQRNTSDVEIVQNFIFQMAEFHISQSEPKKQTDMMSLQFSRLNEYVYVYEILVWLQFRKVNKLPNPEIFTHPMMSLTHNQLPNNLLKIRFDDDNFYKIMTI